MSVGHRSLRLILVTPETTLLDEPVAELRFPLYDGQIGILPGRTPLVGRLGYGELKLTRPGGNHASYFIDGGFVQVADNIVSILTNNAVPAEKLDAAAAREQLAAAQSREANSPELLAIRDRLQHQARAQIRVAQHAGLAG